MIGLNYITIPDVGRNTRKQVRSAKRTYESRCLSYPEALYNLKRSHWSVSIPGFSVSL
jgi:hypothetical protein